MRFLIFCLMAVLPLCAQDWTPKRIVAMNYPPLGTQARIAGDVEILCSLDPDGSVIRAEAISGHAVLKEPARQNAVL
jgi:hypothetical protein